LAALDEVWELARPVVAATERLRTVVEDLKVERTRAVGDLRRAVLNLGHDCPIERRDELARVLYWCHTEVPISDITAAFGYDQSRLLDAVGTVRTKATCEDCDAGLVASTRRQLIEVEKRARGGRTRYGPPVLCRGCRHRRDTEILNEPPGEAYGYDPEAWSEDCYHDGA
jgi:hypothetical protein